MGTTADSGSETPASGRECGIGGVRAAAAKYRLISEPVW